jgi:hypothetical protein
MTEESHGVWISFDLSSPLSTSVGNTAESHSLDMG